jgi:exodeoxyribonuclease V alpha subunit
VTRGPEPVRAAAATDDPFEADLVYGAGVPELLQVFNQAGVLAPVDVHTAVRLARLAAERDHQVALAVALAVRGPRVGHVSVDLAGIRASAVVGDGDVDRDVDLESLPWPDPDEWVDRVAQSPLVAADGEPVPQLDGFEDVRPLHLCGTSLYLDRFWRDEVALAADLLARAAANLSLPAAAPAPESAESAESAVGDLERLFPGPGWADQRAAAAACAGRRLSVLAGGPGTGKTTTVARLLALIFEAELRAGRRLPLVALAAPTGKAAARMEEAVRSEAALLDTTDEVRAALVALGGTTLHRLLGNLPGRPGQFRHNGWHRLPHEVVVVDEASMVSLPLMARLTESVRPDARLALVGDPEQLVSVEAGAVLADIVQPVTAPASGARPVTGLMAGVVRSGEVR